MNINEPNIKICRSCYQAKDISNDFSKVYDKGTGQAFSTSCCKDCRAKRLDKKDNDIANETIVKELMSYTKHLSEFYNLKNKITELKSKKAIIDNAKKFDQKRKVVLNAEMEMKRNLKDVDLAHNYLRYVIDRAKRLKMSGEVTKRLATLG